jgi:hypothetical protein
MFYEIILHKVFKFIYFDKDQLGQTSQTFF